MKTIGYFLLALAASPLGATGKIDLDRVQPVAADQPIPTADFFRPALLRSPRINRSGTHVAAVITAAEDRHVLMVYDLATKKPEFAGAYGDRDVTRVDWLDDRHVMYGLSAEKLFEMGICVGEVGNLKAAYPVLQYGGPRLVCIPEDNPMQPLVWMSHDFETGRDEGVSVINPSVYTGTLIDLLRSTAVAADFMDVRDRNNRHILKTYPVPEGGLTVSYLCDQDDALAYAITAREGVETLQRLVGKHWEKCPVNLDEIDVITAGNRSGELVVLGPRQPGKPRAVQFMDAATGHLGDVILQDPAYDFDGFFYRDRKTHRLIGARYQRNGPRVVWFDANFLAIQKALDAMFPRQVVSIIDWNRDATRFVVGRYTDRQPIIFDWVDLTTKTVGPIKQSEPWIDPARMQPMIPIRFKTHDGQHLDAYLTLPAGASKEHPAPLVVLSHGGPYVRDDWGYDGEVQFLANRGYAVLQPNYRGSPGYNWAFPYDDQWDFVKMHQDVTSATKAALTTKLVDPQRVAIMGGSFGGYLAIFGVVDEPDLYRCAVTIDGVFDWGLLAQQDKYWQYDSSQYGWMKRRLGDPASHQEKFAAISPLRRADRIRVPVFIAHGKDDPVVEIGQARDLIAALDRNHVPHESMLVGGEGHGMGHLQNRVEMYERIEAFLNQYLKPVPAGGSTR